MHSRAARTPMWRARRTHRTACVSAITTAAVVIAAAPGLAATPKPKLPEPESPWTKPTKVEAPATPAGSIKAPESEAEAKPSTEVAAWRTAQKARATGEQPAKSSTSRSVAAAATDDYLPEDQGEVPWHQILDTRLDDALVARVNVSNGNLMLAATDFDIAGVGQKLQLPRTYNSLEAPWGKVSQRWWQAYERYLQINNGEVDVFDATGNLLRFTAASDGTYTTPAGYSKDLKKNADGSYTLTDRKSGAKDTYNEHGTLTKVTDKNKGTITVDQHDDGSEHKGFRLTETRSGRWIDLVKTYPSQWQAKDHTGRSAVLNLDGSGNLAKVTDTAGKATTYEYDSSRRVTKVTTPEGTVTLFTYDSHNRVTSMQRTTGTSGSGHTGPTWRYDYTAATPQTRVRRRSPTRTATRRSTRITRTVRSPRSPTPSATPGTPPTRTTSLRPRSTRWAPARTEPAATPPPTAGTPATTPYPRSCRSAPRRPYPPTRPWRGRTCRTTSPPRTAARTRTSTTPTATRCR
ncbi:hypothetical protein JCM4020_00570 [Streptomyces coelicolor]|nr:hypothetical protein JCM4020_00570 [Streptomyces coelicolor]